MIKISVTVPQAVEMTGVSRSTLYRFFHEKELTPIKAGKRTLIRVDELESFIRSLPKAA